MHKLKVKLKNEIMEKIDGLACVRKMETVGNYISIDNFKELVLESNPGMSYYCKINSPLSSVKHSIYLVIKPFNNANQDKILHLYEKIKKNLNIEFVVYPGQIKVFNVLHSCLKLTIESNTYIKDVIKEFENEGVIFVKTKKVEPYTSLVNTKECIAISEFDEYVFKDDTSNEIYFLEIPYQLEWEEFKEIEMHIKNTFGYKDFETSLISIFKGNRFREFIRVYVKGGCTCESFQELRTKFSSKIKMD